MEHHFLGRSVENFRSNETSEKLVLFSRSDIPNGNSCSRFFKACELMLGETILSAKQLLRKNSEKMFALGTVSGTVRGFKGRSPQKTFKFCSDSICYNANSLPEWQNWHSESSLGKHAPGPLTSLCTKRQFSRGGGGPPIYGLYRYVPRNREWFLWFSVLK